MKSSAVFVLACLLAFGSFAYGGSIGPVCGTCQGGVYDLSSFVTSVGSVNDVVSVILTIDTSLYTGGGLYIGAVAPKVSSSLSAFSLLSAPGGTAGWFTSPGGLNANGCSGAGSGFVCSEKTPGATLANNVNIWSWVVTMLHDALFSGNEEASIKVLFTDILGNKDGTIVSEDVTQVPEPSPLTILGGGLLVLVLFRKKFPMG